MGRLRKEAETILDHRYARRTKKSRRTARTWWQKFCAITKLPAVLDLDFRWKTNILLARDVIGNFLQFVRENQRYHDRERECGHHETPQRYCAPVLSDHDELGIDLRKHVASTIKNFTEGLGRWQLIHKGRRRKRNKRPYSMAMLVDMYELNWAEWCDGDMEVETEFKAALQVAVGVGFRKSEYLKTEEEFNHHIHLTKAHVEYFENQWKGVEPSTDNIRRLLQEGGWVLLTTANLKQSPLQDKWGGFPTPFRIGPEMKGLTLAPGTWLAMKELYNPVTDSLRRARLPLFMHPRKSQWLRAGDFKRVITKVLQRVHANVGIQLEDKEVLEMFNTHSARVAQQVLLASVNAPPHIRKLAGRYSSNSYEDYDRMELERLHESLKKMNDSTATSIHPFPADIPCYPARRRVAPGEEYIVEPEDVVVDPLHEIGNATILRTQYLSARKTNALVGRRVSKWFETQNEFYEGTVTVVDDYYKILYDDGDQEDATLDELVDIIMPETARGQ